MGGFGVFKVPRERRFSWRFPPNVIESPRLLLTGANLHAFSPVTYLWEITNFQQTGYHTTFFWGNIGIFNAGLAYVGFHGYPDGVIPANGTTHKWEISANGLDLTTDDNGHDTSVEKGRPYLQGATVAVVSSSYVIKFYWDLPDPTKVITQTFLTALYSLPPSPGFSLGGAPWATNTENLCGDFGRLKVISSVLSQGNMLSEALNMGSLVTEAGSANLWLAKRNWPSPSSLTCDFGTGRSFAWADPNNPATWVRAA